jgi:hypothetical protein
LAKHVVELFLPLLVSTKKRFKSSEGADEGVLIVSVTLKHFFVSRLGGDVWNSGL